jgi:hypothetical protein
VNCGAAALSDSRHNAFIALTKMALQVADAVTLLRELMLADLERGLEIVRGGHAVVRAWRVLAPDGDFTILTQFDPDKPEQRERAFAPVPRFMAWKLATGFVLTAETWLGPERTRSGEEAVLIIGVSRHDRMAEIRRNRHTPALSFGPPEWLPADALDDTYFRLLPSGQSTVTVKEAAMLAACSPRMANYPPAQHADQDGAAIDGATVNRGPPCSQTYPETSAALQLGAATGEFHYI